MVNAMNEHYSTIKNDLGVEQEEDESFDKDLGLDDALKKL